MAANREVENGNLNATGNHETLEKIESEDQLRRALTNSNMTLSPELFERLYLSPQNRISGELRKTFANPTPVAILGFAVGLFPLSIEFMSWRGSGGTFGTPTTTCSIWFGGLLLMVGGIGEFILGNTFPFVVFFGYGKPKQVLPQRFLPANRLPRCSFPHLCDHFHAILRSNRVEQPSGRG